MPLNANLILPLQPADTNAFGRGLEQGADLSQKMFARKQQEYQQGRQQAADRREDSLRGAMSGAFTVDQATGRMVMNKEGLAGVAKVDPQAAYQLQQQQEQEAAAQKKAAREQQLQQMSLVAQTLNGVKDQQSYDMALRASAQLGLPGTEKMPRQYDARFVDSIRAQAMGPAKEWEEIQLKRQEQQRKQESDKSENALRYAQADKLKREAAGMGVGGQGVGNGKAKGVETLDRDFAKDYNEWTSGGSKIAQTEIQKLRGIANDLKGGAVTTGGLTGFFPDRMTSDSVLKARADVQSTVMNSLRAILGAQFTEKEGERIIKNTWNEADSTENNLARINRLVGDLEAKAQAKSAKAGYFEKNETLRGYKAGSAPAGSAEDEQAIAWAQANRQDPRAMKILELHGVR